MIFLLVIVLMLTVSVSIKTYVTSTVESRLLSNSRIIDYFPSDVGMDFENNYIDVQGTSLNYWWVPASTELSDKSVLIFHGQGETISDWVPAIYVLNQRGFNVMIYDYSGYGLSDDSRGVGSWTSEAQAMLNHFQRLAVGPRYLLGFSLGGAVLLDTLAQEPQDICSLAIVSTFSSLREIVVDSVPALRHIPGLLPSYFNSVSVLQNVENDALFLGIRSDEVIPIKHHFALQRVASQHILFHEISVPFNHNDFWQKPEELPMQEVVNFFLSETSCESA